MDFNQGNLATYTAIVISHFNFYFLKLLRFLKRNGQTFVIYLSLPELDTASRLKQPASTC